jgi:hypothetical protein
MQTTLRVDDRLYREAKAEAARAGVSLTRFIEEGLRLRLEKKMPLAEFGFRTYAPAQPDSPTAAEIRRVADEEQEAHDLARLGLDIPKP